MKYSVYTENGRFLFSTNSFADAESIIWEFGGKILDKKGKVIIELAD